MFDFAVACLKLGLILSIIVIGIKHASKQFR